MAIKNADASTNLEPKPIFRPKTDFHGDSAVLKLDDDGILLLVTEDETVFRVSGGERWRPVFKHRRFVFADEGLWDTLEQGRRLWAGMLLHSPSMNHSLTVHADGRLTLYRHFKDEKRTKVLWRSDNARVDAGQRNHLRVRVCPPLPPSQTGFQVNRDQVSLCSDDGVCNWVEKLSSSNQHSKLFLDDCGRVVFGDPDKNNMILYVEETMQCDLKTPYH